MLHDGLAEGDRSCSSWIPVALTLEDLAAVYSSLFEVRSKWFSIGLELGVDATKLTDIEREGSDDSKALRKMLMIALKKQISGQRLCDTLQERVVDETVLAKNLEINLPRSIISRRLQKTNFTTQGIIILYCSWIQFIYYVYIGSSDIQLASNSSSSSIATSFEVSTVSEYSNNYYKEHVKALLIYWHGLV